MDRRILVCDADGMIRGLLKESLTRSGYDVLLAASKKECLEKNLLLNPQLILLDSELANETPLPLEKQIKAQHSNTAVLMLGSAEEASRPPFILKPFRLKTLLAKIEELFLAAK